MNKLISFFATTAVCLVTSVCSLAAARSYHIVPQPLNIEDRAGEFILKQGMSVFASQEEDRNVALFFIRKFNRSTALSLSLTNNRKKAAIILLRSNRIKNKEGYTLSVSPTGVRAEASSAQGLFYAMQTLMQLFPPEVESSVAVTTSRQTGKPIVWSAPAVFIQDEPRFAYRGIMIDPCRHFFTIDELKKQIDILSTFKGNNLHLHLTEDQGWRVEIRKYPLLTQIGGVAIGKNNEGKSPAQRIGDGSVSPERFFYTQQQLRDLVSYARERFVNIVPELEMPGHELAAIAAYPWLSCTGKKVEPRREWGVEPTIMCAGKESTFRFLEDVADELMDIFPSPYFHIGGDEAPREEWKRCPLCQHRADSLGLKDSPRQSREAQLQSYLVNRMEKYFNARGRAIIGWDEILEGGDLQKSAIVMSWRGADGGIAAAKAGHRAIMTPNSEGYYLNFYEGDRALEPVAPTYRTSFPLQKTYAFEPVSPELYGTTGEKYILGVQGNLWSEYVPTARIMEFRMYPRALAVLETGWTQPKNKDFAGFAHRLDTDTYLRLQLNNVSYNIPIPEQPLGSCDYIVFQDTARLVFKTARPERMYYTTDGTLPTPASSLYTNPITLTQNTTLRIATILPCSLMSPVRTISVVKQSPLPPVADADTARHGVAVQVARGLYTSRAQLANVERWETDTVASLEKLRGLGVGGYYSAIGEALVMVPKDGVYYFHSNYPEVWIDDYKVVDNTDEWVLDGNRNGRSLNLRAGLHRIKVIFLGYLADGRPTSWDSGSVSWRHQDDTQFSRIRKEELFVGGFSGARHY